MRRVTVLLLLFGFAEMGIAQKDTPGMTLSDIIEEVLARNAGISAAKLGVDAANKGRSVVAGQRFPRLDWFVKYEGFPLEDKLLSPRHMDLPTPPFTQPEMVDFFQRQFNTQVVNSGLNVSLPLYTGGRIRGAVEIQEAMARQAEFGLQDKTIELVFAASRAHAMALLLNKKIEANEKAVESLTESRRIVKRLVEVGKATNVDLFRTNARLAEVQQGLIEARFDLERTHGLLNSLMGRHVTDELHIVGVLTYRPVEFPLEESLHQAFQTNPGFLSLETMAEAQRQRVAMARSERFPNLSVVGMYKGAYGDISPDVSNDAGVFLTVSLPLFHGQSIQSNIEKERLILKKIEEQQRGLKQRLSQEVYTAHLGILNAAAQIEVAEIAVLESGESLRIEEEKLKQGKGVVRDLLDAQADHLRAQVKYYRGLSDHRIAVAELQKTVGTIGSGVD